MLREASARSVAVFTTIPWFRCANARGGKRPFAVDLDHA